MQSEFQNKVVLSKKTRPFYNFPEHIVSSTSMSITRIFNNLDMGSLPISLT